MKAWRQQPTSGPHQNRRAQRVVGSVNRNSYFAGGSRLLLALFARASLTIPKEPNVNTN